MSRQENINFLLEGEKELGKEFLFARYTETYGDFSGLTNEQIEEMAEDLDYICK